MRSPAVLFVCLGNICRSPLAEAAFRDAAARAGLEILVDSAGTGDWHIGKRPDPRACSEARRRGVDITSYRARQVSPEDFHRFTHILALDHDNLASLRAIAPAFHDAELSLLLDMVEGMEGQAVADPYYGEEDGFAGTWDQVNLAAEALVGRLLR